MRAKFIAEGSENQSQSQVALRAQGDTLAGFVLTRQRSGQCLCLHLSICDTVSHCIALAGPELRDLPASASQTLVLKVCVTLSSL